MADDWDQLIAGLRCGDENVISEFYRQHGDALRGIADRRISPLMQRRVAASDVVQSAFRTFFRRASEGHFQFADSEKLWSLLCAITLTKVREQVRFHRREKRDVNRETSGQASSSEEDRDEARLFVGRELSPEVATALAEQFASLLESLDEEEREVISMKIDDRTNEEIAEAIGSSERTVQRIVQRLQDRFEILLGK